MSKHKPIHTVYLIVKITGHENRQLRQHYLAVKTAVQKLWMK
jgi:hypothetical protein